MGTDITAYVEHRQPDGTWESDRQDLDLDRNYNLFGFLADVRNSDGITPLAQPRGLPTDISEAVRIEADDYEPIDPSWFGLAELLADDYEQPVSLWGVVSDVDDEGNTGRAAKLEEVANYGFGFPFAWKDHTGFGGYSKGHNGVGPVAYKRINWVQKLSLALGQEWAYLLLKLNKSTTDPNTVRLVFWFDQ